MCCFLPVVISIWQQQHPEKKLHFLCAMNVRIFKDKNGKRKNQILNEVATIYQFESHSSRVSAILILTLLYIHTQYVCFYILN